MTGWRRLIRALLSWPIALLILFEEWGWEPLQRALAALARLPWLAWLERRVASLPPYAALAVFGVPTLLLLPTKLAALALIAHGKAALGALVIVAAKVAGTALIARLYALTRPTLLAIGWFARWHARWMAWKEPLLAVVRQSAVWRLARALRARLRYTLRRWRRMRG